MTSADVNMLDLSQDQPIPGARDPIAASRTPHPPSHPILHPDILPLILFFASDTTLAMLMRVSRHILAEIANLRWPVVVFEPSNRRTAIRSRTSLPDHPHRFSAAMQVLLTQYARMVVIHPHPAYSCPPRGLREQPEPLAQTIQVDRKGLCRSDHLPILPRSASCYSDTLTPGACELCRMFTPTTMRIDNILQHPVIPIPYGLSFATSITRLVLCIEPNVCTPPLHPDTAYLHHTLPRHITEVVFLLAQPIAARDLERPKKSPSVSLAALSAALAEWVIYQIPGHGVEWTIVGAERFGSIWFPHCEGEAKCDGQIAVRREMAKTVKESGAELGAMANVHFVTLDAYLRNIQTRSELTAEEITRMTEAEKARLAKVRRASKGD